MKKILIGIINWYQKHISLWLDSKNIKNDLNIIIDKAKIKKENI